jgi:hypothetical protein
MNRHMRAGALTLALSAGVAAGAAGGCNVVIGADGYKVGTVDAATTDAPQSDAPGLEAGACGSGLPTSSPAFQTAVTTCVLAASCDPFLFQTTISECISEDYLNSIGSQKCLTSIADCTGYAGCTGQQIPTVGAGMQCASSTMDAYCSGTTAINCGNDSSQGTFALKCSVAGGTCGTYPDPMGTGTVAGCLVEPTCTEVDSNQHCDTTNNVLYTCVNGMGYGQTCDTLNATCKEDPVNGTSCYFNGATCSTPGHTCNSMNQVKWCTSGGVIFTFNCGTAGLTCTPDTLGGTADCVAPGCTVDDYNNCTETCAGDGHTMNLCVGGAPYTFDCKTLGFKTCTDSTTNGVYCGN